jgi:hypothetical protein
MIPKKVAYLTPLFYEQRPSEDRGRSWMLALAQSVTQASHGSWQVEVISYGESPFQEILQPGVTLRILPAVRQPTVPWDVLSWELPEVLAQADLVHIYDMHTRSGEMGLLVAKLLRKPICVSDLSNTSSSLGMDLQIATLADRLIPLSEDGWPGLESSEAPAEAPSSLLARPGLRRLSPGHPDESTGARLLAIYQDLVAGAKGVAA